MDQLDGSMRMASWTDAGNRGLIVHHALEWSFGRRDHGTTEGIMEWI